MSKYSRKGYMIRRRDGRIYGRSKTWVDPEGGSGFPAVYATVRAAQYTGPFIGYDGSGEFQIVPVEVSELEGGEFF